MNLIYDSSIVSHVSILTESTGGGYSTVVNVPIKRYLGLRRHPKLTEVTSDTVSLPYIGPPHLFGFVLWRNGCLTQE
jgi:hypothetical protein